MILGSLIEAYSRQEKISIRDLSKRIGIKFGTLYRIMRGESTKSEHIVKLMAWLMSGSTPRK